MDEADLAIVVAHLRRLSKLNVGPLLLGPDVLELVQIKCPRLEQLQVRAHCRSNE